ncbi:MAG TPA: DUF2461 domain-containing protein [Terriglobia bacterium]|nr:DUF2461 domain-containing protein [Terriglobia bacterium]
MKKGALSTFPKEGLQFLRSLKRNNNREWFQKHKPMYEAHVKKPIQDLVQAIAVEFAQFAPEMVASPKVSVYRIYRDTRFSKDKSPYKTHAAAVFPRAGLGKHEGAAFYLHITPTELLIGGGLYMPSPEDLNAIRSHLAGHPEAFLAIVKGRTFRRLFGTVTGAQLSRIPAGFRPDHPVADYLKHKQFLAGRTFPSDTATSSQFYKLVMETFRGMLPFVRFLNDPLVRARRTKKRQEALLGL